MMCFLNIGGSELILILFIVLLIFGPSKIPELAKGLGKGLKYINNAGNNIKNEIEKEIEKEDSESQETSTYERELKVDAPNTNDSTTETIENSETTKEKFIVNKKS